jgi:hypothetical protein
MTTRYSACHFAEITDKPNLRCSHCGEICVPIPMPPTVGYDVELTLRRWKDGDCESNLMLNRLIEEYCRVWDSVFSLARDALRRNEKPVYVRKFGDVEWHRADDAVSDLEPSDHE